MASIEQIMQAFNAATMGELNTEITRMFGPGIDMKAFPKKSDKIKLLLSEIQPVYKSGIQTTQKTEDEELQAAILQSMSMGDEDSKDSLPKAPQPVINTTKIRTTVGSEGLEEFNRRQGIIRAMTPRAVVPMTPKAMTPQAVVPMTPRVMTPRVVVPMTPRMTTRTISTTQSITTRAIVTEQPKPLQDALVADSKSIVQYFKYWYDIVNEMEKGKYAPNVINGVLNHMKANLNLKDADAKMRAIYAKHDKRYMTVSPRLRLENAQVDKQWNKVIAIGTNEKFDIDLPDNSGSTGYKWVVTSIPPGIKLLGEDTIIPTTPSANIGASKQILFHFASDTDINDESTLTLEGHRGTEIGGQYTIRLIKK